VLFGAAFQFQRRAGDGELFERYVASRTKILPARLGAALAVQGREQGIVTPGQRFQFAGIQPDAPATLAVIHFDVAEPQDQQADIAFGTDRYHGAQLTIPVGKFHLHSRGMFVSLPPMKSHERLREVFETASPKEVADRLGLSLSMVYKWAESSEDGGSGAANPLDRVAALMSATNQQASIAQWVCERAGGFYVANPVYGRKQAYALVPATNAIVQEFADMLSVIATAAVDNHISPKESEKIRARWEDLKRVTEGFVRCCEEGNFAPIRDEPR